MKDRPYIYVSVFGLGSPEAINDAVFDALIASKDFSLPPNLFSGIDAIGKKFTGAQLDLRGAYRNIVLRSLPKLIVFDDLERAAMPAPQLRSALNPYVEHKGRSVLLIANESELKGPDATPADYRKWREKVIGRIVTLTSETETALTAFLQNLPEGPGKTLLIPQSHLIRSVFEASTTQNLRLLRQSLTDLARFLDRLPEQYRDQSRVLPNLMGTYLALSIAWHAGVILQESDFDFAERETDFFMPNGSENTRQSGWDILSDRYSGIQGVDLGGRSLSGALAFRLIVSGHASDTEIIELMVHADAFHQPDPEPWRILWYWTSNNDEQIDEAYNNLQKQLSAHEITRPDIILHVFGIFLSFAELGLFGLTKSNVITQAQTYIDDLLAAGNLPASWESFRRDLWQWSGSSEGLAYTSRETEAFKTILAALIVTLDKAEETIRPDRLETLLKDLESDPTRFRAALAGGNDNLGITNLKEDPIFLAADPAALAARIFALNPDRWHHFLSPFEDRISRQDYLASSRADNRPTERDWLLKFRTATEAIAAQSTPLKRQQILRALRGHLAFLDPPSPETTPTP